MTYMQNGIVTEMRDGELIPVPLKAGAVVLVGTFALVDDTGFAVASTAAIAATQKVMGVWDSSADNTDGESGDVLACVRRKKQFLFRNSTTDAVTQAELGEDVFVEDNQTVAKTTGAGLPIAGKFMGFDTQFTDCVWVEI
ncbi:hypothetical protein J7S89_00475 [Acinetobacter baumannii]|uniref:DUF2190 family protein n=2 Tax=Acinetobacter baumannii TaxID=470 RepID=A0A5N5Y8J8_ACIBA|nr:MULTISPECIES: hypothetical protein [Acinetobacter]EMT95940.1 hypothetical protein ABNIH6_09692 [Acinetobacter baumannii ABNIH6]EMU17517.1 hypothetical protein ABNIH10_01860 [Acinetobacter baumannii ABNIH10]ALJ87470.1 hypothetical protein AN415_01565 [Acinetobacter baumannii]ARG32203.1 hypothetical protein B7L41_13475 [Acinetobacter baumannii]AVF09000.1 hypothetical protein AM457_16135 [Acinetobacter baumannii]